MDIGSFLKSIRKKNKMTLEDVGTKAGITFSYVSGIEHGRKIPMSDVFIRILNALNADFEETIKGIKLYYLNDHPTEIETKDWVAEVYLNNDLLRKDLFFKSISADVLKEPYFIYKNKKISPRKFISNSDHNIDSFIENCKKLHESSNTIDMYAKLASNLTEYDIFYPVWLILEFLKSVNYKLLRYSNDTDNHTQHMFAATSPLKIYDLLKLIHVYKDNIFIHIEKISNKSHNKELADKNNIYLESFDDEVLVFQHQMPIDPWDKKTDYIYMQGILVFGEKQIFNHSHKFNNYLIEEIYTEYIDDFKHPLSQLAEKIVTKCSDEKSMHCYSILKQLYDFKEP